MYSHAFNTICPRYQFQSQQQPHRPSHYYQLHGTFLILSLNLTGLQDTQTLGQILVQLCQVSGFCTDYYFYQYMILSSCSPQMVSISFN